jgi:hypothetical protein
MIDLWDVAGFVGAALVIAGAYIWHPPAAAVVTGSGILGLYCLRESRRAP